VTAGINSKRGGESCGHEHGNEQVRECGGSATVPILSQLSGSELDALSSALTKHLGAEFLDIVVSCT
jgi:hypothetical protein